jgi:hypothetical protein
MYSLTQVKTLVSCGRDPARSLPLRRGFLLIPLMLVCFAFSPNAQAAPSPETPDPPPGQLNDPFGTADGRNALRNVSGGFGNSAFGWFSLFSDTTASFNTGLGAGTLALNNADQNTAVGTAALILNTTGTQNTAVGTAAMVFNDNGVFNGAVGAHALENNVDGFSNNAVGNSAMIFNISGAENTAVGDLALQDNDSSGAAFGNFNTAVGANALLSNVDGDSNVAVGVDALTSNLGDGTGAGSFNNAMGFGALGLNVSGAGNVAVGDLAGGEVEGSFNIYIGFAAAAGVTAEDETIRIGDEFNTACFVGGIANATVVGEPVLVAADGQLGVAVAGSPLSASEILKERQVVQQLKATTEKQAARIALQEGQIEALTAALKQQSEQIQKVSAQLEMIRPAPRVVENR